jgi:hypothetical protein
MEWLAFLVLLTILVMTLASLLGLAFLDILDDRRRQPLEKNDPTGVTEGFCFYNRPAYIDVICEIDTIFNIL